MSDIYENSEYSTILDGGTTVSPKKPDSSEKTNTMAEQDSSETSGVISESSKELISSNNEIDKYRHQSAQALKLVDDIVLKKYLTKLSDLDVIPLNEPIDKGNIILYKVNRMVYEKDEFSTDKFISVVSAMTYSNSSICLIVDGHDDITDFYLGIKSKDNNRTASSVASTLKKSMEGQFPGAKLEDISEIEAGSSFSIQDKLLSHFEEAISISSCVGVPAYKNSKGEYTNANFIQGIEKFTAAMHGKTYTAIILATNTMSGEISELRYGYEKIYTDLSAMATQQLSYSTNESLAQAINRTKGFSDAYSENISEGTSKAHTNNSSSAISKGRSKSISQGESSENAIGKIGKGLAIVGGVLGTVAVVAATGGAALPGVVAAGVTALGGAGTTATIGGAAAIGGAIAGIGSKVKNKSVTETDNENRTDTIGVADTDTLTKNVSRGNTHSEQESETTGETKTNGSSKNFSITIQDKHIQEMLKRIDKQLARIDLCESTGLWSVGAYFLSYGTDRSSAETSAAIFRSIMQGEQSGIETSAINTWYQNQPGFECLTKYSSTLSHPLFSYSTFNETDSIELQPTAFLSSKELAILMGLPRKSVPGLPVVEHVSLAKEVVRLSRRTRTNKFDLGHIYDQGIEFKGNRVWLDGKSLTQHMFVSGSTGSGKSNTIYYLLSQIRNQPGAPKFLIIEPAKGEYKDVFGNEYIYGTNPLLTPLLRINPFKFPDGVHVLEHIDRLIEIFNVCWPMYAAMPAVLKEAVLNSYENCGWDLYKSVNTIKDDLFPTFADLQNELIHVISNSANSEEVKGNYQGSLVTRVKSLNNGICREIFTYNEIGDKLLFDENVIIDLSRLGSQETKSLIMGIIIMRLSEYRANSGIQHNSDLRHITVIEEAHNILKKCSQEQSAEGSNVTGKSVEMLSNAIAEMRTYGEGFIIVDQSPGAVDISAIRNTNTKIIMRLPEESDRRIAGKSAAMKDYQIDEISKLPTGVAVVYQNDWEEPVLCRICKFEDKEIEYKYRPEISDKSKSCSEEEILKLLLKGRVSEEDTIIDIGQIEESVVDSHLSTNNKLSIFDCIEQYKKSAQLTLWKDQYFERLSRLVAEITSSTNIVSKMVKSAVNFEELTISLRDFLIREYPNLSEKMILALSQCLMKDYSLGSDSRKQIYSAWYQTVLNSKK